MTAGKRVRAAALGLGLAAALAVLGAGPGTARAEDYWASARITTRLLFAPEVSLGEDANGIRLAVPWVSLFEADAGLPGRGLALRVRGYTAVEAAGDPLGPGGGTTGVTGTGNGAALAVATLDWAPPKVPIALRLGRQLLALGTGHVERGDGLRVGLHVWKIEATLFAGRVTPPAWILPLPVPSAAREGWPLELLFMGRVAVQPIPALHFGVSAAHVWPLGGEEGSGDLVRAASGRRTLLGIDAALAIKRFSLLADAVLDLVAVDLAAASAIASYSVGRWSAMLGARRVAPELFLPVDSLLRAFAGPPRDETWLSVLAGLGILRVGAEVTGILFADGPGLDVRARARLTAGGPYRPALDATGGWLAAPSGGYVVGRIGGRMGSRHVSGSIDATGWVRPDAPAHGVTPFTGAVRAAFLWRISPNFRAGVDAGWATTPWMFYGFTAGLTLEGGLDERR